jgi:hypothetical protein
LFFKSTKNNIDLPETLSEKLDPQRGQYLRFAAPSSGSKKWRPELGCCPATLNIKYLFQLSVCNRAMKTISFNTDLFRGIIFKVRKSRRWGPTNPIKLSMWNNVNWGYHKSVVLKTE